MRSYSKRKDQRKELKVRLVREIWGNSPSRKRGAVYVLYWTVVVS